MFPFSMKNTSYQIFIKYDDTSNNDYSRKADKRTDRYGFYSNVTGVFNYFIITTI